MKRTFLIALVIACSLFLSGCTKVKPCDSLYEYNDHLSALVSNVNTDSSTHYDYYFKSKTLIITFYPNFDSLLNLKPESVKTLENVELGKIERENGKLKSFIVDNTKYVQKF